MQMRPSSEPQKCDYGAKLLLFGDTGALICPSPTRAAPTVHLALPHPRSTGVGKSCPMRRYTQNVYNTREMWSYMVRFAIRIMCTRVRSAV